MQRKFNIKDNDDSSFWGMNKKDYSKYVAKYNGQTVKVSGNHKRLSRTGQYDITFKDGNKLSAVSSYNLDRIRKSKKGK